jgi:hypothetical protein
MTRGRLLAWLRSDEVVAQVQRRLPWVIAGACVFVALVVVFNVVLQAGYPKRPEDVAARFVEAGTCQAGGKYAVPGYVQRCDDRILVPLSDVVVVRVDAPAQADVATVTLLGSIRKETLQEDATLVRQDGKWKVLHTRVDGS